MTQAFEVSVFCLPYFDPRGLIIAEVDGTPVGFVHAGFGFRDDLSGLNTEQGVICALLVVPEQRRQGIGTALLAKAEEYLRQQGVKTIDFGQSKYRDPFYMGLHGGARLSGVCDSDPGLREFLTARQYAPALGSTIFQCDLSSYRAPSNMQLIGIRHKTELQAADPVQPASYWWYTHLGNVESLRYRLVTKRTGDVAATVTVIGLDHYINTWRERVIGLVEMQVAPPLRGQGYGAALMIETMRRLRSEMNITLAEIHVPHGKDAGLQAVAKAGFVPIEEAHVYRRTNA